MQEDESIIIPKEKLSAHLRMLTPLKSRLRINIKGSSFSNLCQVLQIEIFNPFFTNRNKIYFEECCWSFSKISRKKPDIGHSKRICLNDAFPLKSQPNLLQNISEFLINTGKSIGLLRDDEIPIPYINKLHDPSQKSVEEDVLLGKREIEDRKAFDKFSENLENEIKKRKSLEMTVFMMKKYMKQLHKRNSRLEKEVSAIKPRLNFLEQKLDDLIHCREISQCSDKTDWSAEFHEDWGATKEAARWHEAINRAGNN